MSGLLFVSQALLDSWAEQGKIDFRGGVMTLLERGVPGRSYALEPASHFLKLVGAERDPHELLGRVKTDAQLRRLGAEKLADSVLVGDVAYEVQPGFLAEVSGLAKKSEGSTAVSPSKEEHSPPQEGGGDVVSGPAVYPSEGQPSSPPLPDELEKKRTEAEALARFLLRNLP
ncbi:MAG TPA: hypothetical protein VMK12_10510 [Anaeromyxobacteraceae bacterium]|nr:hypothetical protein [Anaeromyxobacteraceae bacterium]